MSFVESKGYADLYLLNIIPLYVGVLPYKKTRLEILTDPAVIGIPR